MLNVNDTQLYIASQNSVLVLRLVIYVKIFKNDPTVII